MKSEKLREERKDKLFIFLMVAPAVLLLIAFVIVPLFLGFYTSLYRTSGGKKTFIGFDNYRFAW